MTADRGHELRARAREAWHAILIRPRHLALAALVAGLLVAQAPRWLAPALVTGVLVAGAATRRIALGLAASAVLLAGAFVAEARLRAAERPPLRPLLGRTVDVDAYAVEAVRVRAFGGWSLAVRARGGPMAGAAGPSRPLRQACRAIRTRSPAGWCSARTMPSMRARATSSAGAGSATSWRRAARTSPCSPCWPLPGSARLVRAGACDSPRRSC